MHHKLIISRLINRDGLKIKRPEERNDPGYKKETDVGVDHVPLCASLAHVICTELGQDPFLPGEDRNKTVYEHSAKLNELPPPPPRTRRELNLK